MRVARGDTAWTPAASFSLPLDPLALAAGTYAHQAEAEGLLLLCGPSGNAQRNRGVSLSSPAPRSFAHPSLELQDIGFRNDQLLRERFRAHL